MAADRRQATILVTDAGRGSAVSVIRSLGRSGYDVIAADSGAMSPGFYSRYVRRRARYPSPANDPDAAARAIVSAAVRYGADLVFPVTDEVILPLARLRPLIGPSPRLAIPDDDALAWVTDKDRTVDTARDLGIPVPRSVRVSDFSAARRAARSLGWPVVLKPLASRAYRPGSRMTFGRVRYAYHEAHLREFFARPDGRPDLLVQEYVAGEGRGVEVLAHAGRPIAVFQHRRLREVPVTGGASAYRESMTVEPNLYDYAARLLATVRWTGLAMVEFKVGPTGPYLMEVNGRVWGSLPLAARAGVDFPSLAASLYLDGPPPPSPNPTPTTYPVGIRSHDFELELTWIANVLGRRRRYNFLPVPPRREAIVAAASLIDRRSHHDVLSLDDPKPGLADVLRVFRAAGNRLVRATRSSRRTRRSRSSESDAGG